MELPIVWEGSTVGAGNDYAGSCVSGIGGAPDMVFQSVPTSTGEVTFSTDDPGTSFDTGIYVRQDCSDDFSEIACADGPGGESLTFMAEADTEYYLFVDGYGSDEGDFVLTLTLGGLSPVPSVSFGGAMMQPKSRMQLFSSCHSCSAGYTRHKRARKH